MAHISAKEAGKYGQNEGNEFGDKLSVFTTKGGGIVVRL